MKSKLLILYTFLFIISLKAKAQDTIAAWTFPTGTSTDANPDHHNAANALVTITTQGGTSAIDFSKNGFTTKAAQSTSWDGGANLKYWQIEVNTTNYNNLTLSSKQTAGGSYPGPRDWKAQYKVGASGTWTDIPGTTLVNANNWTSAVISNITIPSACIDQSSVFIRWLMISDTSIAPPALVMASGTTKIDDIYIMGSQISAIEEILPDNVNVFPNPNQGHFGISSNLPVTEICVFDIAGKQVYNDNSSGLNFNIDLSRMEKGLYFIRYRLNSDDSFHVEKILIQ